MIGGDLNVQKPRQVNYASIETQEDVKKFIEILGRVDKVYSKFF